MRFVLYAILAYIIFQFVFRLVIPVYLATRRLKKGFREMHSRMQEQPFDTTQGKPGYRTEPGPPKPEPKTKTGDYIDFEEVK